MRRERRKERKEAKISEGVKQSGRRSNEIRKTKLKREVRWKREKMTVKRNRGR